MATSSADPEQSGPISRNNAEITATHQSPDTSIEAGTNDNVSPKPDLNTSVQDERLQAPIPVLPSTETLLLPGHRHDSPLLHSPTPVGSPLPSGPPPPLTWFQKARRTWIMNKGMFMVMLAQFFGASMNTMTRTLQLDGAHGKGMDPFQILFVRMLGTVVCSAIYMWYAKVPHPLGIREVRSLLVIRGVTGFFGVFGLYYSLVYLPLSEATVLTFLAPILCCYACSLVIQGEVFTRKQQFAGVLSLVGVILIARPMSLFSHGTPVSPEAFVPDNAASASTSFFSNSTTADPVGSVHSPREVTPEERFMAILAALMGVIGATGAYTSIRKIGQRAHPLVSVTYFSTLTTVISVIAVLVLPSVSFRIPGNWTEVLLLFGLASCGFLLQFLLTAGLSYVPPPSVTSVPRSSTSIGGTEKTKASSHGSRATSMVYTQMLFALFYDKVVWDATPSAMSWAGSGIILGSALYVALAKDDGGKGKKRSDNNPAKSNGDEDENEDDDDETNVDVDVDLETGTRSGFAARWSRLWKWGRRPDAEEEDGHDEERRGLLNADEDDDHDHDHEYRDSR